MVGPDFVRVPLSTQQLVISPTMAQWCEGDSLSLDVIGPNSSGNPRELAGYAFDLLITKHLNPLGNLTLPVPGNYRLAPVFRLRI